MNQLATKDALQLAITQNTRESTLRSVLQVERFSLSTQHSTKGDLI